jgi:DNA modification methylase
MKDIRESEDFARTGFCLSTGGILYPRLYKPDRTDNPQALSLVNQEGESEFLSNPVLLMTPANILKPGVLYRGDNLHILRQMEADSVDLIYLDPPFFSNRNYEVIWGDEAEVRSFMDRWDGGIERYIDWMEERCRELHRVLAPTGSLYLHCDWHAGHYLKVMLDDVFGSRKCFQNEVVWYYRGGGVSKYRWGRRHDTLLYYTKSHKKGDWTFNVDPVRMEYSESVLESSPSRYDKSYRGDKVYSGYRPNPLGKHPDDVWPIQPLMPSDKKERLGYPTQKPEALLQNVILASSNPGDLVLDPFAGCGTTINVAAKLGRDWLGIDISPSAIELCERRLGAIGVTPEVRGMPATMDDLQAMPPFEFQKWVCYQLNARPSARLSGDKGVDGRMLVTHAPVQVKQKQIGRPDVDAFETAIERAGSDQGVMVGFGYSREAREEVARIKRRQNVEIVLYDAKELLGRARRQQIVEELTPKGEQLALDAVLMSLIPKDRPSVEELIASELQHRGG